MTKHQRLLAALSALEHDCEQEHQALSAALRHLHVQISTMEAKLVTLGQKQQQIYDIIKKLGKLELNL
jgi:hypothetical protein